MFEEKEEILEGKKDLVPGTSTDDEQELKDEAIGLNNATVPTREEEENAGIVPENATPEAEENADADFEAFLEDEKPAAATAEVEITAEAEAPEVPTAESEPDLGIHEASAAQTFTQSQVDEIAGKIRRETRDKTLRAIYSRYGVNSEEELDDIYSDAQRLATLQGMYDDDKKSWQEQDTQRANELAEVKERVALLESGIDKDRYEDAKFILKGKGLEVTVENIMNEIATHPEWKKKEELSSAETAEHFRKADPSLTQPLQPEDTEKTTISVPPVLGNPGESANPEPELSDRERAMRLFKV